MTTATFQIIYVIETTFCLISVMLIKPGIYIKKKSQNKTVLRSLRENIEIERRNS